MTLYTRQLHARLLLVPSANPLHHVLDKTEFARQCEQSTELHFTSLDEQLQIVTELAPHVNGARRSPERRGDGDDRLRVGDIYLTRHSNLPDVHVAVHMVTDAGVNFGADISSRHPCITGLRNTVRTCARYGITHLSLPLLLVDTDLPIVHTSGDENTQWYVRRAELVFKCVKGFLMEVAAYGSTSDITRQQQHYTIEFTLPPNTPARACEAIVDLFPTIYHLVDAVRA